MKCIFLVLIFLFISLAHAEEAPSPTPTVQPNEFPYDYGQTQTTIDLWLSVPAEGWPYLRTIANFDGRPILCELDTGSLDTAVPCSDYFSKYKKTGQVQHEGFTCSPDVEDQIHLKINYANLNIADDKVDRFPAAMGADATPYLGIPVFLGRKALFDFTRRKLVFGVEPTVKQRYPLELSGEGHFMIPVRFEANTTQALWDTGAQATMVSEDFYEKNKELFEATGKTESYTDVMGKENFLKTYICRQLTIGGYSFSNVKVAVTDFACMQKKLQNNAFNVILGLDVLVNADWYFDASKKEWALWTDDADRLYRWQKVRNSFEVIPWEKESLIDPSGFVEKDEAEKLKALLAKFSQETGADVRVLVLPSVGNWDIGNYLESLGQIWAAEKGTEKEWIYMVYCIATHEWNYNIRDAKMKFAINYNKVNVTAMLHDVIEKMKAKQCTRDQSFRLFMEKMEALYYQKKN
jgi:hypothetical protein